MNSPAFPEWAEPLGVFFFSLSILWRFHLGVKPPQSAALHAVSRQCFQQVSPAGEVWRPAVPTPGGWKPPLALTERSAWAPLILSVLDNGNPKVTYMTSVSRHTLDHFLSPARSTRDDILPILHQGNKSRLKT
ncbi:hypothetical protein EYF80_005710 [Liparis tanakae]|uniref:Uncharacterized protein n=1 Tax=Liparis tanakae TaxID=230148 RepID=A0A4Z2J2N0_9TELE|nr:hypothetical protein EYF80_005710 [Liparis tanakae]